MDLDLAHVRSFLAIVRYGGYHRAAEALHLTQPAVSRHMRRLEEQLGEPLFAKRGRGVELTPFGEQAAVELGAVLAAHDPALARLQRGDGDASPFVLGAIENLVDPVLPDLIAVVREHIGERALQLRVDRSVRARGAGRARRGRRRDRGRPGRRAGRDRDRAGHAALVGRAGARRGRSCRARCRSSPTTRRAGCAISPCAASTSSASSRGCTARAHTSRRARRGPQRARVRVAGRGRDGLRAATFGPLAGAIPASLWLVLSPDEQRAPAAPCARRCGGRHDTTLAGRGRLTRSDPVAMRAVWDRAGR